MKYSKSDLVRAGFRAYLTIYGVLPSSSSEVLKLLKEYFEAKGLKFEDYFESEHCDPYASLIYANCLGEGCTLTAKQHKLHEDIVSTLCHTSELIPIFEKMKSKDFEAWDFYKIVCSLRGPDVTSFNAWKRVFTGRIRFFVFGAKYTTPGCKKLSPYITEEDIKQMADELEGFINNATKLNYFLHWLGHVVESYIVVAKYLGAEKYRKEAEATGKTLRRIYDYLVTSRNPQLEDICRELSSLAEQINEIYRGDKK